MTGLRTDEGLVSGIRDKLLGWYGAAHRDFPWRRTRDPYAILVSEVMLQQTQAGRIAEAYPRFMARYPTAADLAAAPLGEVLASWSGLGYNRRALALQRTASVVSGGGWPRDVAGLQQLPGVGPYTARALAALAFGQPVGVVDTNVRRWLVRRFGLSPDIRPAGLQQLADELASPARDARQAGRWIHASMEFGARICTSRAPRCGDCPIADSCPSRDRAIAVPVPRQAAYRGSRRAQRGAVVRLLASAPDRRLAQEALRQALAGEAPRIGPALAPEAFEAILAMLGEEGLVRVSDGQVELGTERPISGGATIDP